MLLSLCACLGMCCVVKISIKKFRHACILLNTVLNWRDEVKYFNYNRN